MNQAIAHSPSDAGETALFKIRIQAPIQTVWREVTKTDEVQAAMFNMRMDSALGVGDTVRYRTGNGKYTGIVGEVLAFEPPSLYVHTFRFTQFDDPACTVAHRLREVDGAVEYVMECTGLPPGTKSTKQMKQGGSMITNTLKAVSETGKVPFGTRLLYVLFRVTEPFSPARTKSDRWP